MYIDSFDAFLRDAEALYRASPLRTRYCCKYRHADGELVLKVTDDCLQFRTDQQADVKKVEQANALFMGLMARGLAAPSPEAVQVAPPPAQPRQQAKAQRGGKGRR